MDARRGWRIYLPLVAATAVVLMAQHTAAADQCISKAATAALTCTGKTLGKTVTKRKGMTFKAPTPDTPRKPKKLEPKSPTDVTTKQPRHNRKLRKLDRQLLWQEINNVTRLYQATPLKSRDRPRLMRRLAENYVELESAAFRDQIEAADLVKQIRKLNPTRAKMLRKRSREAARVVGHARKKAIRFYRGLAADHPRYCRFPSQKTLANRGCNDEVLYYLAFEYEQARNAKKARDVYLKLIDQWPRSKFVPNAYLAFGELYFNEAQGDPSKWPLASKAYERVTDYPAPANKLWGYAHYKLGYVHWNQGRYAKAIDQFKKVIAFGTKYPNLPNSGGLTAAARRDIVPVYALKGDAKKAFAFFQKLSGDNSGQTTKTIAMVESLGTTYMDTGHYAQAITLYGELITRNRGSAACGYHAQVARATMAMRAGNKASIIASLDKLRRAYQESRASKHSAKRKRQCGNTTAKLLATTAMAWHLEAIGSGNVRGTMDPITMRAASKLYGWVSKGFTAEQFAKFKFPHIVKEDWPSLSKITYHQADLLYSQGRWRECAEAFDAAFDADPTGVNAADALYAAASCWRKVFDSKHEGEEHRQVRGEIAGNAADFEPKKLAKEQQQMIRTFDRYACNIKPPKKDRIAMEQYVEVKFARARTYYEAAHYDKAAVAFRDIALNHSDFDAGVHAGNLYLETLNIMYRHWDGLACANSIGRDVHTLVELYCGKAKLTQNEIECGTFARVARHSKRLKLEAIEKLAKRGGPKATELYRKAAEGYLALWNSHGKAACKAGDKSCKGYDEVLYNAAVDFQAARLLAKAIRVREILVDPTYHLHQTPPAHKAMYQIGANYQAIAVYDKAAHWYEVYAKNNPKKDDAPTALSDAVVLRLGLGQHENAFTDARLFTRQYGARKPQQAAQIAFAMGAHHVSRKRWREAERTLTRSLRQIEKHAAAEVKLQALAMLGKVYGELERDAQAARFYGRVRDASKDVASVKKAIEGSDDDKRKKARRLGKALMAMGEAHYFFAEKARARADALVFPRYRGSGTKADVDRFVKKKITKWMEKKVPAIKTATAAYMKVIRINDPKPPPRWAIAAGAAIGGMWGELVDDFITAPYPKQWDQPGYIPGTSPPLLWVELRAAYKAALAKKVAPYKKVAKDNFESCLEYGIIHQYFDGKLRSCERWLSKKYPNEYHIVDEFRGSPTRVNSGLDERPRAITVDGRPAQAPAR